MKKLPLAAAVIAATAALAAPMANAYQAGDVIIRAGAATVDPSDPSSSGLLLDGAKNAAKVSSIDSDTQLGLTGTYMLTDRVGIELLAATPFKHTIKGKGGALGNGVTLGSTKHLPPTVSLQYYFMPNDSKFQPYAGLGINYTHFFDEDVDAELKPTIGNDGKLELKDSWGLAAQAGMDYALTDNIVLNAAVWYMDIKTEATFKGSGLVNEIKAKNVTIDPWVYMVGVGYKF